MTPQRDEPAAAGPTRDVVWTGYASFFVLGLIVLLVPSLIRQVEAAFGVDDAAMGAAYLLNSVVWVVGTISAGMLVSRMDRHLLLGAGPASVVIGLLLMTLGGTWPAFLVGFMAMGFGAGVIDSGTNALFMDLFHGRQAGALNRLHLWVSVGAMTGPLAVGRLVGAGVPWQAVALGVAAVTAPVGIAFATRRLPAGHVARAEGTEAAPGAAAAEAGRRGPRVPLPIIVLAVAIACYVAMEAGVTGWLVRYLDAAALEVATLALALFWGGMALARLLSSFVVDRIGAVRFAATGAVACGCAVIASLAAPSVAVAVLCFALAGFAAGPIYPMIMAIAGSRYPDRTSTVASVLASAGIVGSIVYPPLLGAISSTVGLRAGIAGAGVMAFVAAGAIVLGAAMATRAGHVTPTAVRASQD